MTKVTNKQIANCFRKALKYLWDGKTDRSWQERSFICYAISDTGLVGVQDECEKIIQDRLGNYAFATNWLIDQGVDPVLVNNKPMIQAWRKQWLEQLIEEFENK